MGKKALHGEDEIHAAAKGIFDILPEDPFGEGEDEEATGKETDQESSSGDRSDAQSEEDEDFDAEATEALDDEDEEDESEDEGDEEDEEEDDSEDEDEDEDDSEDDEDGDESEADKDPMVTVKVDGETTEIPLSKALEGYSRTASWTRKSQKLADERREFEADQAAVRTERNEYGARLQLLEEQIGANLPEEPSPSDPQAWIRYQQEREKLASVQAERVALHNRMQVDAETQRQAKIAEENTKLVELVPEWQDSTLAEKEKSALAKYAVEVMGFPADAVEKLIDHRLVLLLRKGMALDSMKKAKGEVKGKVKKAKVLKPGQPNRKSSSKKRKARRRAASKRDTLRKTGSVEAAADFILESLEDEE